MPYILCMLPARPGKRLEAVEMEITDSPEGVAELLRTDAQEVSEGLRDSRQHVEALSHEGHNGAVVQQHGLGGITACVDVLGSIRPVLVELVEKHAQCSALQAHTITVRACSVGMSV